MENEELKAEILLAIEDLTGEDQMQLHRDLCALDNALGLSYVDADAIVMDNNILNWAKCGSAVTAFYDNFQDKSSECLPTWIHDAARKAMQASPNGHLCGSNPEYDGTQHLDLFIGVDTNGVAAAFAGLGDEYCPVSAENMCTSLMILSERAQTVNIAKLVDLTSDCWGELIPALDMENQLVDAARDEIQAAELQALGRDGVEGYEDFNRSDFESPGL